jgi:hypothetical protein
MKSKAPKWLQQEAGGARCVVAWHCCMRWLQAALARLLLPAP